jgi:hypothetical protein
MPDARPSRLELTRQRVRAVRFAIVGAAVIFFGGAFAAARAAHPGTTAHSGSSSGALPQASFDRSDSFGFGDGSIGPSDGGAPQVATGSS